MINGGNMIEIQKAKKVFEEYIKQYEKTDPKVQDKLQHTLGVIQIAEYIAKELALPQEEIELAKLIALLHDIGRFEQLTQYGSSSDLNTMDHADYGVKVLKQNYLINQFIEDRSYDEIIFKAIENHNKYKIAEGLNQRELLHAKLIRDADKTDNFILKQTQNLTNIFDKTLEQIEKEEITKEVYEQFMQKQSIDSSKRKTSLDWWVSYIAWIFDYNFSSGLAYLQKHDYINGLINRIVYQNEKTKKQMKEIQIVANEYIKQRCEK